MRANLVYHDNGVGLSADAAIVARRLQAVGYDVVHSAFHDHIVPRHCDISVFLEVFDPWWLEHCETSYLIPNQEWISLDLVRDLTSFEAILCKSRFAQTVLRRWSPNTPYIGFTSRDRRMPAVRKDPRRWMHLAGKSSQKSTATVIETWLANPDFPTLTFVHDPTNRVCAEIACDAPNVVRIAERLTDRDLAELMNSHQVHICPSEMEGFGHSLNEALSCQAVTMTTDAPPMNEIVTAATGVTLAWSDVQEVDEYPGLRRKYRVDATQLAAAVRNVLALSGSARQRIGERAREAYLARDRRFVRAFDTFFGGLRSREVRGEPRLWTSF